MTLYEFLKFLHVVLVIIAVGFNASYGIWFARAAKEPEHEAHVVRGIKILDDRFANPAYVLILLTGVGMVLEAGLDFQTFWIAAGLGLYVVVALLGIFVYTPLLKKQVELAEAGQQGSEDYQKLAKRGRTLGIVMALITVTIVFLMVTKPELLDSRQVP